MKQPVQFTMRSKVTALFCALVLLAGFSSASFQVNSQSVKDSEQANEGSKITAEFIKSKVQGSENLTRYGAFDISADSKTEGAANARVAVAADFNGDGIGDVIVAGDNQMTLRLGDINAFAPQTEAASEVLRSGRFVSPFKKKIRATNVPVAADFVFAGDFNRDTFADIAFAARGDNALYVLEGDGRGNFPNLRRVETAGAITALASGDANRADGLPDLVVGINGGDGAKIEIFSGLGDILAGEPQTRALPAGAAEAIAVGRLNEDEFADIAVAAGSEIDVLSGADTTKTDAPQSNEILRLAQTANIKSIVVGDFLPDRDDRAEIAYLTADGSVQVLQRGALDSAPVTRAEHLAEQVREYRSKGYPVPQRILRQLSRKDLLAPVARPKTEAQNWSAADTSSIAAPDFSVSPQAILTAGRVSRNAAEDLIVLDSANSRAIVLPFETGREDKDVLQNFNGKRQTVEFNSDNQPVVVLPMRLNNDGDMDLLFVGRNQADFKAIISAPSALTFTVNSNLDAPDANLNDNICQTSVAGQCTLRAAIMQANHSPGNDTININSGIGTITINLGQPDNDALGTNDQSSGDLDITCVITTPAGGGCDTPLATNANDLTINGAAGGSVVQAGTFTAFTTDTGTINTDRVFDIGQDGIFGGGFGGSTGIHVTMSNLTIQNGNVREALNTASGAGNYAFGGAIRFDGFGNGNGALTLTSCTINNNQSDNTGGGVMHRYGSFTATNSTFSNNITKAGDGGGGFYFGAGTSNSNVNISGSTFTANEARQGIVFGTPTTDANGGAINVGAGDNTVTVGTTNFTNNIAQLDGGAVRAFNGLATITGGTMSGNTARRHGGAIYGDIDTAGTTRFLTVSGSTIQNNTANSDGLNGGDGGAIFRDRGTQNITGAIIGGTGASQPNTATNGGGVAHAFTVPAAMGNTSNQTTININGGSINGNIANTDGGGVYFNAATFTVTASALNIGATTATAFDGNKAKNNGGGIIIQGAATATLKNMTLSSNKADSDSSAAGDGGAFYQNVGTTSFTGTLAVGSSGLANSAVNGGGISNASGALTLPASANISFNTATGNGGGINNAGTINSFTGATISNNSATTSGGGIYNTGTITVDGATLTNNTPTGITQAGGTFNSTGTNTLGGNLLISGGTFNAGSSTVNLGGNFNFTGGTFTQGTSTFNFNGTSAQTVTGTVTLNNLTINNSSGVTLNSSETVGGTLTLTSGNLAIGTNTLTLNGASSATGGTFSSAATGTVNYNQGTNGQIVLAGNYGNLTFSNFNKTLPSSGTIGVAGTFTPGSGTATITGSTFDFNGAGAQTVPVFNFNNLTISGARGAASVTLASGTIGVAGAFNPSATNVSYITTGNTINFNGAGAQTVPAFSYNNLTTSGARGGAAITLASGTINVAGAFTPGATTTSYTTTGNTFVFNGSGAQTIPAFTFNNLSTATGGTKTLGGAVTVGGNLIIGTGTTLNASTFALNVAGNFTNQGTFAPGSGTVILNGTTAQSVSGMTFNNLTANNAAGITFTGAPTINGVLSLQAGFINTGAFIMTLPVGASATRGGSCNLTNCFVASDASGGVLKQFNTTASSFTYPVGTTGGTDNGYSPVALTSAVSLAGTSGLTVSAVDQTSPAVSSQAITRYWQLTESGNLQTDMAFTYLDADDNSVTDLTKLRVFRGNTNVCATDCVNEATFTGSVTGITDFSPWTIAAPPAAPTASTVSIGGRIVTASGRAISRATVSITDGNGLTRRAISNPFGYFRFADVEVGNYAVGVKSKGYVFTTNVINALSDKNDLIFVGQPGGEAGR